MDQTDVATLVTALLILFFFHQVGQLWSRGQKQGAEKNPVVYDREHRKIAPIAARNTTSIVTHWCDYGSNRRLTGSAKVREAGPR